MAHSEKIKTRIINATRNWYPFWKLRRLQEIHEWEKQGKPLPMPILKKVDVLSQFAKAIGAEVLIETGTYKGDMIFSLKDLFKTIYSIELDKTLYERAKKRFQRLNKIHLLNGDSSGLLQQVVSTCNDNCLFWLDAHYSGGITSKGDSNTPIMKELEQIFNSSLKNFVIIIDDSHCFDGTHDYPAYSVVQEFVANKRGGIMTVEDKDDMIRIYNANLTINR